MRMGRMSVVVGGLAAVATLGWWWAQRTPLLARHDDAGQLVYTVAVDVAEASPGQKPKPILSLTGRLAQTTHARPDGRETVATWRQLDKVSVYGVETAAAVKAAMIGQPILSVARGAAVEHYLADSFPVSLVNINKNIFNKLTLPGLEQLADGSAVDLQEEDELGPQTVRYTRRGTADGIEIERQWVAAGKPGVAIDRARSVIFYRFDRDGALTEVRGTHVVRIGGQGPYVSDVAMLLVGGGREQLSIDKSKLRKVDRATLANWRRPAAAPFTTKQLVESVARVDGQTPQREVSSLYGELRAAIEADPALVRELAAKALAVKERDEAGKRQVRLLFGVLAQNHRPEAANALVDLVRECGDAFCAEQAAWAFNDHPAPSAAAAKDMLSLAQTLNDQDLAGSAWLAAASAGRKLGAEFGELPAAVLAAYQSAAGASDGARQQTLLAAMGNHGDDQYLPTLRQTLADTRAEAARLRETAAFSLRYVPGADATAQLVETATRDPSAGVVGEALKALEYRDLTATQYQTVADRAASGDKELQLGALRLLLEGYRRSPEAAAGALKALAAKTQLAGVKEKVAQTLASE